MGKSDLCPGAEATLIFTNAILEFVFKDSIFKIKSLKTYDSMQKILCPIIERLLVDQTFRDNSTSLIVKYMSGEVDCSVLNRTFKIMLSDLINETHDRWSKDVDDFLDSACDNRLQLSGLNTDSTILAFKRDC
jgi:hypothetical protein